MTTLTIFTPTYNRAYCLHQGYEALKRQTCKDFMWLVIDDGSTDKTRELVEKWQKEADFTIQYIYKENGGLHTGYNVAIANITTELSVCIDSDDFMPDDAVEKIITFWQQNGNDEYAGIIGLDFLLNGKAVGGSLPDKKSIHLIELNTKYKYKGDTKLVYRTEILKRHIPMPTFHNEKNFNPIYIMIQIDEYLPLLILNENFCFVNYQAEGMANNILHQYKNSPNSFAELRRLNMSLKSAPKSFKFMQAIHYVSSCIFARDRDWLKKSPLKILTIFAIPFGMVLFIYIQLKTVKTENN